MTHFEYISALVSFAVALGVGELLVALARLIRRRESVDFDWLHGGASGLLVLLLVQFWWGFWNYRDVDPWSFGLLVICLTPVVSLVLAGLVLLPSEIEGGRLSLRDHYLEQHTVFYALAGLTFVFFGVSDVIIAQQPLLHPENLIRLAGVGICGSAAISTNLRFHSVLVASGYVLLGGFIALPVLTG